MFKAHNIVVENSRSDIRRKAVLYIIALMAACAIVASVATFSVSDSDGSIAVSRPNDYGFSPKMQLISSFCTDYSSSKEDRRHNIALACDNFSWIDVKSGGTLSFNTLVGKRTEERGYRVSKVIVDGEYTEGVGGGVCQVSTTLYNAWIRAGLGVKYVRAHSLPASYCELSQDATVTEFTDLVLVNDCDYDVLVNGYVRDGKIHFDVYGDPLQYTVKIRTELLETISPPEAEIVEVEEFPEDFSGKIMSDAWGEYAVKKEAREGYKSRAFADYYDKSGNLVKSEELRKDSYLPVRAKILRKKVNILLPQSRDILFE